MILVVADTSPLRYLVEIGCESLLPRLFSKVWIPGTVTAELRDARTPAVVRQWAEQFPSWVEVRQVECLPTAHELAALDRGEWEAIELAKRIQANLPLIDERTRVQVARTQGLTVTGTLGVLVEAARSGLIAIDEALARLAQTSFCRTPDLFAQTRELVRKSGRGWVLNRVGD
jgi:predicted nucleic acid-binding protein